MSLEMMKEIEQISGYLRGHFAMLVRLVGHGDDPANVDEYIRVGRARALSVMRVLVDQGVSASRIAISQVPVADSKIEAGDVPAGSVEVTIEPRFAQPKKGNDDAE